MVRAPSITYDSGARPPRVVEEFRDLLRFRDLLLELVANNLKARYKRSALGVAWTLLNPLVLMLVMSLAFSQAFRGAVADYPLYVFSGLLLWSFFSQSTLAAMQTLVWSGSHLMNRVYLPRTIYAVAAVGTGALNLLFGLVPLALVMLVLGRPPTTALLFLPVSILCAVAFVQGVALLLSAVAIYFVDVIDIFQAATMALFYLTPVVYPASLAPEPYRWLPTLNPLTHLVDVFRYPIHLGIVPPTPTLMLAAGSGLLVLALGWWVFTRNADELAYRT